ncbi:ferredoxin [Carboxydocella sp. JDF658]|uniref:ferredoxin n=1 Tax=Carboxydocella sp. JDF658 TaxID=1926600 RepID=UPI0009AC12F3|nr:ferredoxin [Carboxydocella sp. JDF658]GAW31189.1 ferredoxin [Carboxydocella sp. JDF658]
MRARVNKDLCIGCGACAAICPQVFELGENGLSRVIADPVPAEAEASARDAADGCPVGAIKIEE